MITPEQHKQAIKKKREPLIKKIEKVIDDILLITESNSSGIIKIDLNNIYDNLEKEEPNIKVFHDDIDEALTLYSSKWSAYIKGNAVEFSVLNAPQPMDEYYGIKR